MCQEICRADDGEDCAEEQERRKILLKAQKLSWLSDEIKNRRLGYTKAAKILGVGWKTIQNILKNQYVGFSLARIVDMETRMSRYAESMRK